MPSQLPLVMCGGCRNLEDRTREVYRENLRMSEALMLHTARVEELETRTEQLESANRCGWWEGGHQ